MVASRKTPPEKWKRQPVRSRGKSETEKMTMNPTEKNEQIMKVVADHKPRTRETEDQIIRLNRLVQYLTSDNPDAWVNHDEVTDLWTVETEDSIHQFVDGATEQEITVWIVREFTEDIPY